MNDTSYDSIRTTNEEDRQQISFDAKSIHSVEDLRAEMRKIGENISTVKTNWQSRVKSIQQIGNLISGNILNTMGEEFIALLFQHRDAICCQITELRSGITKEIFRVLSFLAIYIDEETKNCLYIKQKIQAFADYIVPYIMKQLCMTILVISHGSNICVRTIIKRIPLCKCIPHIVQNTNVTHQKAICLRVRCMEYLQIMIDTQAYHRHYLADSEALSRIVEAVVHAIADPHPSVRYVARQCVWSLEKTYPNRQYAQYIVSKLSPNNTKYVMSEQAQHHVLPSPVGMGHKIDRKKGLKSSRSMASIKTTNNNKSSSSMVQPMKMNRPKSALPSRKHRLELLKRRKKEMAGKIKKSTGGSKDLIVIAQAPQRPQTAHPQLRINGGNASNFQMGAPRRNVDMIQINHGQENKQVDDHVDAMMIVDDENEEENVTIMRKISIMGSATRFSTKPKLTSRQKPRINTPKLQQAVRVQQITSSTSTDRSTVNSYADIHSPLPVVKNEPVVEINRLDEILTAIGQNELNGINDLSKYLQEQQKFDGDIEGILLALCGFIDGMTMNKQSISHLSMESLVLCCNNLILYAPHSMDIQTLMRLLSKLLRLFVTANVTQYMEQYDVFHGHLQLLSKSMTMCPSQTAFSLQSICQNLSQSIVKPKQKLIWLHFISILCRDQQQKQKCDEQLVHFLFSLLKECLFNPQFAEYHCLFQSSKCDIVSNILQYIVQSNAYDKLFANQLNDTMIETLCGIISNASIIQIFQKYYSRKPPPSQQSQQAQYIYDHHKFTTPSHQNKKYQRIRKIQIESMTTPPLNMYMTTPAPMNNRKMNSSVRNNVPMTAPVKGNGYRQTKENINTINLDCLKQMSDEQLLTILLEKQFNNVFEEKNVLKYLSHRINGKNANYEQSAKQILFYVIDAMNGNEFLLHRNALRILQALCWFYPSCINENLQMTLACVVNLFRKEAPEESGELALDVITQFCKVVDYKQCIEYLMPMIQNEIGQSEQKQGGRKMFAAVSVFDRVIVLCPIDWLKERIEQFTNILVAAYKYHREPMRSLIYLSIILDGDTEFLSAHYKEQKIVQMMHKEADFTKWVQSHRQQEPQN